jgi:hypothetical protein
MATSPPPGPLDFKDAAALLPLLGAIGTYWLAVRDRRQWTRKKSASVGDLGRVYEGVITWPDHLLSIVTVFAVLSSLLYFAYRLFYDGLFVSGLPPGALQAVLQVNYDYFLYGLFIWLVVAVTGFFNLLSEGALAIAGAVRRFRHTLGYVNASWRLDYGDSAASVTLGKNASTLADQLLQTLANAPANDDLALRPAGLTDEEAANVLYFGHVVEEYYTQSGTAHTTPWTPFYETLGAIAAQDSHPFAAAAIRGMQDSSFFFTVLKQFDGFARPATEGKAAIVALPNSVPLEQKVDAAFRFLRDHTRGDARNFGKSWLSFSYGVALKRIASVITLQELQRQFAKLAVIWNLWLRYRKPRVFNIPFSRGIALYFLDMHYVATDGSEFRTGDQRFKDVMELAEQALLESAFGSLQATSNPAIVTWRNRQRTKADQLKIDWQWYAFYRIDQQIYATTRRYTATGWEAKQGGEVIARKEKAA